MELAVNRQRKNVKSECVAFHESEKHDVIFSSRGKIIVNPKCKGYENIDNATSVFETRDGMINIREAILLCRKAHCHIPIFKQTIEVQTEFSNSKLYFEGGTKESRKFFEQWDKKIKGWSLRDQFFREYFRSGNIFLFRLDHELPFSEIMKTQRQSIRLSNEVPIRYVVLDPALIECGSSINFIHSKYFYIFNEYVINRLRFPSTDEERELKESLPEEVRRQIDQGASRVLAPLPDDKVYSVFVKKQDYEALAVPMYYCVLFDINLKTGFKNMEQKIAKTIDYMILLINMGSEDCPADEATIRHMNNLFKVESVGRVLVSDHNTKINFVIPKLNEILGPEKYEVVNKDIADGLMNIFFKEENYSNSSIKIKVFLERLLEAQHAFLEMFYKPEMERIGKSLGFKSIPEPKFADININDSTENKKLFNRLYELGVLTPEELKEAWELNKLPEPEESVESQTRFKELKDKGLYAPSGASGSKDSNNGGGREPGTTVDDQKRDPIGASVFNIDNLSKVFDKVNKAYFSARELFKSRSKAKRLSKAKKLQADKIAELVFVNEPIDQWEEALADYMSSPKMETPNDSIIEIAEEHGLDYLSASFLHHSRCITQADE